MTQIIPRPQLAANEAEVTSAGEERRPVLEVVKGGTADGAGSEAPGGPPMAGPLNLGPTAAEGKIVPEDAGPPQWTPVKAPHPGPRAIWLTPAGFLPFPVKLARADPDGIRRRVRPIPFPPVTPRRTYLEERLLRWVTPRWPGEADE